jgi:hypothetical protein
MSPVLIESVEFDTYDVLNTSVSDESDISSDFAESNDFVESVIFDVSDLSAFDETGISTEFAD